ncbi:MAG: class I SAM-dependent methyltransferase [Chloroflexota bacterium]
MSTTLAHPNGRIIIDELGTDKRRIQVDSWDQSEVVALKSCETSYPIDLIKLILKVKGLTHLCDEIMRDEDPFYVQRALEHSLCGYVDKSFFAQKTILDFGCGCGSSTMALARLFPDASIVGVDMEDKFISVARARAEYYAFSNITFLTSPTSDKLSKEIVHFDFVVLSGALAKLD